MRQSTQIILIIIHRIQNQGSIHISTMCYLIAIIAFVSINLINQVQCHFIPKIKDTKTKIFSYVNQAKQIDIPFKKCFQVSTQLPANRKYINFQPSSLKLTQTKSGRISENRQISVLEDLRSPQSYSHQHLIVFDDYALTFLSPNLFLVIKEQDGHYRIKNKIIIKEINKYTQFKIYKFNNQAIVLLYNEGFGTPNQKQDDRQVRAFIITQGAYEQIKVPTNNMIAHFQANGKEFFTAQYGEGVRCYSYSEANRLVKMVASYTRKLFSHITENPYIVDINIDSLKTYHIIYALDGILGVFRINLTDSQRQPKIDLVISEPNCNAMDSMSVDHLVLVCQLGSSSYIVEAYATQNDKGQYIFNKLQPEYHVNYFNDLEINKNYFLVFSHRTLNVYWSSKENNIPQTVNTRSQLNLPGLETFYFRMNAGPDGESYLYIIQSGVMKQMLISQSKARLTVKSLLPVEKKFQLSIFGNCQDLSAEQLAKMDLKSSSTQFELQSLKSLTCQVQKTIQMEIVQQNLPRKEDFSVSASIIVILIVIFLLVIWICLKKYKGLERQARKVLQAYKKKRSRL